MLQDMHGKLAVVTGANTGIGKETAKALADLGAHVVMACRSPERGQAALDELMAVPGRTLSLMLLDLADLSSVRRFADEFTAQYGRLDVLVNNAGVLGRHHTLTKDGFELQLQTNYLGHFLLTMRLLPLLEAAPEGRIVMLSSIAHTWTDVHFDDINLTRDYNRMTGYGQSKLCNLLFCRYLAAVCRENGSRVRINAAHPGIVASDIIINRRNNMLKYIAKLSRLVLISAEKGARTSVYLAADDGLDHVSGEYFVRRKIARSSPCSRNMESAARLFKMSKKFCKDYL